MQLHLLAFKDLLTRYGKAFSAIWKIRNQLDSPQRKAHEVAFLPAHLELAETPAHPAPQWAMRLIVGFVALALLWAFFGKMDIVAVAQGKLIPNAQVKLIQAADSGLIRHIHVKNGQRVKAGDILVELDTTITQAEADKMESARLNAALTVARVQAVLDAQKRNAVPHLKVVAGTPLERQHEAQHLAEGQYLEYKTKLAAAESELIKRQASLETTRHEIEKLKLTAPLAKLSADNYQSLVKDKYVSNQEFIEKEQTSIGMAKDLSEQESHARELAAGVEEQRKDIASISAQFLREQLDTLNQAQQQLSQYTEDETKAKERQARMRLIAPVNGTVQQLAIHTLGGVVQPAQTIMEIVPDDTLVVEASLENKDIGFVNEGQMAVVKIEAFPYTSYGYLTGTVTTVANDAAQDKRKGLIYLARIKLSTNRMKIENKWVNLTPGMAVTVEIKTGKRTVADYFLSPLKEYSSESLRER